MRKIILVLSAALLCSHLAYAADGACEAKAAEKKLAGAAKTSFINKCVRDSQGNEAMKVCESKAADKKLAGAAKNSFIKKCERNGRSDEAMKVCEGKAAEKKLAGAAKASFTKKCVADAMK